MLNELIEIHHRLKELGVDFGDSAEEFNPCPKTKQGFKVFLDKNGHVEDVDLPDFSMNTVYRWNKGNFDAAFSAFNARSLCEVTCDFSGLPFWLKTILEQKASKQKKKDESKKTNQETQLIKDSDLKDFIDGCKNNWCEEDISLIKKCMKDLPQKIEEILDKADGKPDGYCIFKELVRRAGLSIIDNFFGELKIHFEKKLLVTGRKEYANALFAISTEKTRKRRGKEHGRDFLYLLTIKDWDDPVYGENRFPPYPYAGSSLQIWMSQTFKQHNQSLCKSIGKVDAFGLDIAGAEKKYMDVKGAANFGKIKIFASNEQTPCLTRYSKQSTNLFPAGSAAREMARESLQYLLSQKRKGITWRSLVQYEGRNTVAFAYCTELKDVNFIKVFDDDVIDGKENIYISEEATRSALKIFDGIAESESIAKIVFGIIASVDLGNDKILASRHYPINIYKSGAIQWQKCCANIPELILPVYRKREYLIKGAIPIYPTRAIWLLNKAWKQNGDLIEKTSKRFFSMDALDFLFEKDTHSLQAQIDTGLESLVSKSALVLIKAKLKATINRYVKKNKLVFKDSIYIHMLPTLYGVLLFKNGIRKETYMKENVFYLGKYFAVVDKLHIQYSLEIRNGDVPLRLIGNDQMSLALENPREAFIALEKRLRHPYYSWAKRVDTETIPRRTAKKCIREIADLTSQLTEIGIPNEIDDAGKAKLILGYLSYGAKEEENDNTLPQNINMEVADHE